MTTLYSAEDEAIPIWHATSALQHMQKCSHFNSMCGKLPNANIIISVQSCVCGNIALRKKAIQSSTHLTAEAGRAVDGDRNPDFFMKSCTHTDRTHDTNPWWIVDLDAVYSVNYIVIYNRNVAQGES